MPEGGAGAPRTRFLRALRSGTFLLVYSLYLTVGIGLGQRLLLWPTILLFPRRRATLVRGWLRLQALATLGFARVLGRIRVTTEGTIPPESCIVVMNHQSLLDIPLGISLILGPYPLIPTRDRYKRGVPGISPLARLAEFPFVSQRRMLTRAELGAMRAAAEKVARGERSLLIFPEGHRSRDGRIGRFMRSGLRIVLEHAKHPVYCVVVDGFTQSRTFADGLTRFANIDARAMALGPFQPPDNLESIDPFIEMLREQMIAALDELRGVAPARSAPAVPERN
jgi:1-acyl-sn-glycerol-3-phosphate acyltransferase